MAAAGGFVCMHSKVLCSVNAFYFYFYFYYSIIVSAVQVRMPRISTGSIISIAIDLNSSCAPPLLIKYNSRMLCTVAGNINIFDASEDVFAVFLRFFLFYLYSAPQWVYYLE